MTDDLAAIFDQWATWEKNRRLYAPSPNVQSIMGSLIGPRGHDRPDAPLDPLMPFLHAAVASSEEHGPIVIAYHYKRRHGKRDPVKRLAQQLGISKTAFYRRLPLARKALYGAATRMQSADGRGLMHWYPTAEVED